MMERALMTPDELKSIPKGHFIVMKTGTHPMRTRLRLFTEWGIGFEEPYTVPEKSNRSVAYANRDELIQSIELYTQKLRDDDQAEVSDEAPQGGMELTQSVVDEKKEKKAGHKSAYKSPYNTGGVK